LRDKHIGLVCAKLCWGGLLKLIYPLQQGWTKVDHWALNNNLYTNSLPQNACNTQVFTRQSVLQHKSSC